jgi:membrane protease YdiL (CAAX protease family)
MAYEGTYPPPHPAPPSGPPELPPGVSSFPRWPAWYGPAALVGGFVIAIIAYLIVKAVAVAAGGDATHDSHAVTLIATILQDLILVATAVGLAALTARPRLWHFGLRSARFWPTVGWAALGFGSFWLIEIVYVVAVHPSGKQHVTEDLGAKGSTLAIAAAAFAVIVVAPACEEIFFRGFFYRALRTRMGVGTAALVDGLVFGAIHYGGSDTVQILPILAVLGMIFCLVYEATGTIFATIALHALNNTISYGASVHDGAIPAAILGACTIGACMIVPRFLPARVPALG